MYLAKSIDELYEEVKKYDLVMCNDAPLASALNNRVDEPRGEWSCSIWDSLC